MKKLFPTHSGWHPLKQNVCDIAYELGGCYIKDKCSNVSPTNAGDDYSFKFTVTDSDGQ
jgi:hypothetical protein